MIRFMRADIHRLAAFLPRIIKKAKRKAGISGRLGLQFIVTAPGFISGGCADKKILLYDQARGNESVCQAVSKALVSVSSQDLRGKSMKEAQKLVISRFQESARVAESEILREFVGCLKPVHFPEITIQRAGKIAVNLVLFVLGWMIMCIPGLIAVELIVAATCGI